MKVLPRQPMLGQHCQIRILKLIIVFFLVLIFMIMLCTVPPSGSFTWCSSQRHRASWLHHATIKAKVTYILAETGAKECKSKAMFAHAKANS